MKNIHQDVNIKRKDYFQNVKNVNLQLVNKYIILNFQYIKFLIHLYYFLAKWYCENCNDYFCSKCFGRIHRKGRRALHSYIQLRYFTPEMKELRDFKEREERRKIEEEKRKQKLIEEQKIKTIYVTIKLQSLFRKNRDKAKVDVMLKEKRLGKYSFIIFDNIP